MKDFIISLNNSNKNSNYSAYTQNLFDKATSFVPYFKSSFLNRRTSNTEDFVYTLPFSLKTNKSSLYDAAYRFKKIQRDLDAFEAWQRAVNAMKAYRNYRGEESYDALVNGIPANFFGDFVQIGDVVIPTYANRDYFRSLSRETRTTIINVSITIVNVFAI